MLWQNLCCYFVWGWGGRKLPFTTHLLLLFHCIRVGEEDYAIMKKYNLTAPLFNEELQNTKSCLVLIFIFIAYERNLLQFYIQMHWQTEDDMFSRSALNYYTQFLVNWSIFSDKRHNITAWQPTSKANFI